MISFWSSSVEIIRRTATPAAGAGKKHIERMQPLAIAGRMLGTYISQNVHDLHDRDWQA